MNDSTRSDAPHDSSWWISENGKPAGPYSEAFVIAGVTSGTLSPLMYACPVNQAEWKRISEWLPFAAVCVAVQPPLPPDAANLAEFPLTNPKLPRMANWICVFTIFIVPLWWFISDFSCCVTGSMLSENSRFFALEIGWKIVEVIVCLGISVFLFLGGLRLRSLRRSGLKIIKIGLILDLAFALIGIIFVIGLGLISAIAEDTNSSWAENTTAGTIISFVLFILGLVYVAFEITALIWLYRNEKNLLLTNN
jgi:hypothetical protein